MHGPASTSGGSYKAPTWPDLPWIDVLDTVALKLQARRNTWRAYREEALEAWGERTGLRFLITEGYPKNFPKFDPTDISDEHLASVMVKPYLRLMKMKGLYGGSIPAVATWLPATNPAAVAIFDMQSFWNASVRTRRYRLIHEIGHCLGLNHRSDDTDSVMKYGGSLLPDDHDIDSLRAYYFGV